MVQAGLVERAVDAADRRSVRFTLTPAGRERVATINQTYNRYYQALLRQMSEKDQRLVVRAVRLLAGSMRRLRPGQPGQRPCRRPAREV